MSEILPPELLSPDVPEDPSRLCVTMNRAFCGRHGAPLTVDHPRAYRAVSSELIKLLLARPGFTELVNANVKPEDAPYDLERAIERLLDETPACCRIGKTELMNLYLIARIARRARCELCGKYPTSGTPYPTQERVLPHVCFSCVVKQ